MRTPAVYDMQTEKLAVPETQRFAIGTAGDVRPPVASPWGNRGGFDNIERLLAGVDPVHATVTVDGDTAMVEAARPTATIYVESTPVGDGPATIRNGATVVLGTAKSDLWEGYRLQVFF